MLSSGYRHMTFLEHVSSTLTGVPTAPSGISDASAELEQTHEVWAPPQLSTSSLLRLMLQQSRIECSILDQAPTSEYQKKHEPGAIQFHENGRPLQDEEFNTAFYGHFERLPSLWGSAQRPTHETPARGPSKGPPIIRYPGCPWLSGCRGSAAGGTRGFGWQTWYPVSRTQTPTVSRWYVRGRCEKTEVIKAGWPGKSRIKGSIGE